MFQIWDVSKISNVLPMYWRLVVTTLWAKQNILQHFAASYSSSKSFCQNESKYRYNAASILYFVCIYHLYLPRRVPLVVQEQLTLPDHMSSSSRGLTRFDLLRFTASVYPFRICKPFYYNVQFIQITNYNSKS